MKIKSPLLKLMSYSIFFLFFLIWPKAQITAQTKEANLWFPPAEWSYDVNNVSGNAFDLDAKANFSDGKSVHLFYDQNNTWKLRYMCSQVGTFNFTIQSSNSSLSGKTGSVICKQGNNKLGNLTPAPNDPQKFFIQGLNKAVVPAWAMMPGITKNTENASMEKIDNWIENNIKKSGFIGAHDAGPANAWYDLNCNGTRSSCSSQNPDPATFRKYEQLLEKFYINDAFLHIWLFWDCQRDKCDKFHDKTREQERFRKYFSARLGAYPNWMIGEGFDNFEDDTTSFANKYFHDFNKNLPWFHFIGMRGYKNNFDRIICTQCNYNSWESQETKGMMDYNRFRESFTNSPTKPPFEEDRYRMRNDRKGPPNDTEQGRYMWRQVMSGGVGAIYGYLLHSEGYHSKVSGYPDHIKKDINVWYDFWYGEKHRYMKNMKSCDEKTADGVGLCDHQGKNYVFYKENTQQIKLDSSLDILNKEGSLLDSKSGKRFKLTLGQSNSLPYKSDWVIYSGDFEAAFYRNLNTLKSFENITTEEPEGEGPATTSPPDLSSAFQQSLTKLTLLTETSGENLEIGDLEVIGQAILSTPANQTSEIQKNDLNEDGILSFADKITGLILIKKQLE